MNFTKTRLAGLAAIATMIMPHDPEEESRQEIAKPLTEAEEIEAHKSIQRHRGLTEYSYKGKTIFALNDKSYRKKCAQIDKMK